MRNIETRKTDISAKGSLPLLNQARMDERSDQHFSVSIRLEALAIHIQKNGLSGKEAAELLRKEAVRFERSAQELR
ncbi:DUF2732 family protein [Pectobacteriaceae bacterium CE70]|uniref:DUF2732 family protein n=1 Tax=Brenneria uluponensis TaxID=3057057 RepID=UPI0028E83953|nr:DUF2732 family protein [Brenneria ulupoensis]WJV64599.1 DUF2732 family protein [Pectobacteriaceae bacterium C52]WJV68905.1 DUF2732 family protein [Pectobacteriaceae bacterium CE70]WJY12844.1 DUF2732 family protein [Pectobacteriaceae bacterium C80]